MRCTHPTGAIELQLVHVNDSPSGGARRAGAGAGDWGSGSPRGRPAVSAQRCRRWSEVSFECGAFELTMEEAADREPAGGRLPIRTRDEGARWMARLFGRSLCRLRCWPRGAGAPRVAAGASELAFAGPCPGILPDPVWRSRATGWLRSPRRASAARAGPSAPGVPLLGAALARCAWTPVLVSRETHRAPGTTGRLGSVSKAPSVGRAKACWCVSGIGRLRRGRAALPLARLRRRRRAWRWRVRDSGDGRSMGSRERSGP